MAPKAASSAKRCRPTVKSPELVVRQPSNLSVDSALVASPELAGALLALPPAQPAVAAPTKAFVACKEEETDTKEEDCLQGHRRAQKGCGMNPLEVSRMLAMLKKRGKKDRACLRIRNAYVCACLVFNLILIHIAMCLCSCCTCIVIS